jgi:hypothetical protein
MNMKRIWMPTQFCSYSWIAGLVIAAGLICQPLLSIAKAQGLGPDTDILYVGDDSDNTIKIFRASDGASLNGSNGAFVKPSGGLRGPMGLLIAGPELIVDNQNVNLPIGGEISQYQLSNGSFAGTWVSKSDPNAPFAPRGAVIKNGVLYVANFVEDNSGTPGQILVFAGNGELLGSLVPTDTTDAARFRPRGMVVGPDGLLYVSSDPNFTTVTDPTTGLGPGPTTGGQVLRFDPETLSFVDVFINDPAGGVGQLNRPEGLVFAPDGKHLYVTSFCAVPKTCPTGSDFDSIRIYDGSGHSAGQINLDAYAPTVVGETRATAQALLFGPSGQLFVPITLRPAVVGQVVVCDLKACNGFTDVGTLGAPFYLTFGRTDSASLAYPNQ